MSFFWYDSTPCIMSTASETVYINCTERHLPKDPTSRQWVTKAARDGTPVTIPKRAGLIRLLADVDPVAVTAAKLTVDVAAPKTGTVDEKEAAVAEKAGAPVSVAEWEAATALAAKVVKVEREPSLIDLKVV